MTVWISDVNIACLCSSVIFLKTLSGNIPDSEVSTLDIVPTNSTDQTICLSFQHFLDYGFWEVFSVLLMTTFFREHRWWYTDQPLIGTDSKPFHHHSLISSLEQLWLTVVISVLVLTTSHIVILGIFIIESARSTSSFEPETGFLSLNVYKFR